MQRRQKPELLAPAGSLEKLRCAVIYGANAVYLGGSEFSLRAAAGNFSLDEIHEGVDFAHKRGVKVYIAMNIFAHNQDFDNLASYVRGLQRAGVDAVIVSDMGFFRFIKHEFKQLPIFVSVQANITNVHAAKYWTELGANRVTLARELTLSEIKKIASAADIGTEVFIHGAMCMSYSGRCFLSKYLENRDANRGDCAHCCRWKYCLMEEKRAGEYYPIAEDGRGTYIFSSKDLCLLRALPDLIEAGVSSFKIEGRMKSLHYVSVATRVYREAIDCYFDDPDDFTIDPKWVDELEKVSHREYTEGFVTSKENNETSLSYMRRADFVGVVTDCDRTKELVFLQVRNRIAEGEVLEGFTPLGFCEKVKVKGMKKIEDGTSLEAAHANYNVCINAKPLPQFTILRRLVR